MKLLIDKDVYGELKDWCEKRRISTATVTELALQLCMSGLSSVTHFVRVTDPDCGYMPVSEDGIWIMDSDKNKTLPAHSKGCREGEVKVLYNGGWKIFSTEDFEEVN